MAYGVERTQEAAEDLRWLARYGRKGQAALVERSLDRYLRDEPGVERGAREHMRPNRLGVDWALHLGDLRIYSDIDEENTVVWVVSVGEKRGNTPPRQPTRPRPTQPTSRRPKGDRT
jgi:mRNA-degrading endonuclease RelE of RelBE toxin-antitoxin system